MSLTPFEYQKLGADFLVGKQLALLADEMGLGKTAQAILGLDRIRAEHVLIVCPSVARIGWAREFELWSPHKRPVQIMKNLSDVPKREGHVVCSFDYATKNYVKLRELGFDLLIVDEAHFLKATDAQRTKAVVGAAGIIRGCKRTWLISGTPAPNHAGELWVMLYTFGVTKLSYDAFIREYCVVRPTTFGIKVVATRTDKIPQLRQLLSKIMIRRLKKDVMKELPEIFYGYTPIEPGLVDLEILPSFTQYFLPTDRRSELQQVLKKQTELLESVERNMKPAYDDKLSALAAISDSVSTLRRYIGLQKCEQSIEIIKRELESNAYEKIVIFAIHRDVIETIRLGLREFGAVVLYGNTDPEKRQKNIDRFQNNPKCRVFIGNIMAAGTAITLTKAHHVTFVEQDWVPGNNAQAIMRCHRIGQENKVTVRFMVLEGTLDSKIGSILRRKTEQLTQIFD